MININRHNYEEIFIDYLDGNLDYHDVAELMLFLSENPELDAELEDLQNVIINIKQDRLPNKNLLKKEEGTLSGSIIDDKCIAKLEGDLNKEELKSFNSQLFNNVKLRNNLLLILKTKLKKDENIVYPFTKELKKQNDKNVFVKGFFKYAAVFIPAIIFAVLYLNSNNSSTTNNNVYVANNGIVNKTHKLAKLDTRDNDFKIVKIETPNIVAKSVHSQSVNTNNITVKNKKENVNNSNQSIFIEPVQRFLDKQNKLAELAEEQNTEVNVSNNKTEENKNIFINSYDIANNEINSDEYISKIMDQYKTEGNLPAKENSTFGESIAKTFSDLTNVFQFNKQKVDDGKIYRLAFNSKNFEIGRIQKKKE